MSTPFLLHPASSILCSTHCLLPDATDTARHCPTQRLPPSLPPPPPAPGAYNPDAYYQEIDQGYGDVGVDQVGVSCVHCGARGAPPWQG